MEQADAVVIGGGVMGTSIAFHLARRRFGRVVLMGSSADIRGLHYTASASPATASSWRRSRAS